MLPAHTSLFRLAQKLLLIYRLLPWSTTRRPNLVSSPSTLLSTTTLGLFDLSNGHSLVAPLELPCLLVLSLSAASCSCSSTCAFKLCTTPSNLRNRSISSPSGGFLLFLGARPGPGNTHSIFARAQLEQGCFLSHLTLRLRHVTQDRGFGGPEGLEMLPFGFWTRSLPAEACRTSSVLIVCVVWG